MSISAVAPTPFYYDPERLQLDPPPSAERDKTAATDSQDKNGEKHLSMFAEGDDSPSFWDLLDVINPLQHIPVVSNIYREITGDQIGVGARLVGGALLGGPVGLIASAVDCVVEESTGKDTGGHMLALFQDDTAQDAPGATQLAQADATQAEIPAEPQKVTDGNIQNDNIGPEAVTAPVITLPDAVGGTNGGARPMVFSLNGDTATSQTQPTAMPVNLAAPTGAAPVGSTLTDSMPLTNARTGRVMPVPERNPNAMPMPKPLVTVPVSGSTSRSNVPVTGHVTGTNAYHATAATRPLSAEEQLASHPMTPPAETSGSDWFTAAWSQALDKYQRANQRSGKSADDSGETLQ